MKHGRLKLATALGLALGWAVAFAQTDVTTPTPGPSYGPGMMRGYGPGMMGGNATSAGRGAGATGECPGVAGAYGPGMIGGYGPGMIGGYRPGMMRWSGMMGTAPGWRGGGGPGWGASYGAVSQLDLTPEQQDKIARIQEDVRAKNWATMGELRAEQFKLRSLYDAEKPDATSIGEQQKKVDELRRTLLKARVDAHNQMAGILTKEQRTRLRALGPWWLDDETAAD